MIVEVLRKKTVGLFYSGFEERFITIPYQNAEPLSLDVARLEHEISNHSLDISCINP
jgi:hypothetical protein